MFKKLIFTLVTIFILLGLTEVALRLFWNEPHKTPDREDFVKFHPHPNPEIAFTLPPNYYNWAAKIWTNSWGFRGMEIGEKKPGQYRLLAIGDSNMFGSYVTHNQTIMAVFKSRMNLSNHTEYNKFIFTNLCVPGHNLTQYRAVLEEYGDNVSPDFIICGISIFNDFNGIFQLYHDLGFIRREYNHNVTGERWSLKKMGWLSRHTYLGKVIYSLYGGPRMPAKEGNEKVFRYLPASVNPEETVWPEAFGEIKKIKKWAEDRKLPLVFVIFPTTAQIVYPETISRKTQDILDKFLDEEGLLYIDPYKEFLDYRAKTGESPFVDTSTHPNPRALALIADQLVDLSLSKGLIVNKIPEPGIIDVGTADDNDYISYGWDRQEKSPEGITYRWAVNGDTKLLIPAMKKSDSVLSTRLKPFVPEYDNKMLTVELYLNGKPVGSRILKEGWQTVLFKLDGLKTDNYNDLLFRFNYAVSPGDLKISNDIRELTAMVDWIKFE